MQPDWEEALGLLSAEEDHDSTSTVRISSPWKPLVRCESWQISHNWFPAAVG